MEPNTNKAISKQSFTILAALVVAVIGFTAFIVVSMRSNDSPAANFEDADGNLVELSLEEAKDLYSVSELKEFPQDNPVPVPLVGAYWGIYADPGETYDFTPAGRQQQISDREALVGRSFAIDRQFYTWGKAVPTEYDIWTVEQGRIPHISIKAPNTGSNSWRSVANGAHDDYIREVARGFKALDGPAFFTFHHEPDDNVGGYGSAADYVAAFRHIDDIFNQENVENVAMTTVSVPYTYTKNPQLADDLYPGDDVIDWISTDPYNFFTRDGVWRDLDQAFDTWYQDVTNEHPDKPLMFAEWGTNVDPRNPGREAQWFANVEDDLKTKYPAVKAVTYYDVLKNSTTYNWLIDQTSAMKNAFKAMGNDIYFASPLFSLEDGGQDALTAPSNLTLTSQDGALVARWDANSVSQNVSDYALRYREQGSSSWSYSGWVEETSFEITGLNNGTDYEVQVRAIVSSNTKSSFSQTVVGSPMVPPPASEGVQPPTGLNLTTQNDQIIVSWDPVNIDGFDTYAIRYKASDASQYTFDRTDDVTFLIEGLEYDRSYDVEIRTVLNDDKSDWSTPVSIILTEPLDSIAPDVPSNLEVQKCGDRCLRATWDENQEPDLASYAVRYRTNNGDWMNLDRTTSETEIVGRLERGMRYEVQVQAIDMEENASARSQSVFIQL